VRSLGITIALYSSADRDGAAAWLSSGQPHQNDPMRSSRHTPGNARMLRWWRDRRGGLSAFGLV